MILVRKLNPVFCVLALTFLLSVSASAQNEITAAISLSIKYFSYEVAPDPEFDRSIVLRTHKENGIL